MAPLYWSGRNLVSASAVSYMWLSASNTSKSRTRDGIAGFSFDDAAGDAEPGPSPREDRSDGRIIAQLSRPACTIPAIRTSPWRRPSALIHADPRTWVV